MDHGIWCVPSAPNPNILKARRAQDEHVIPPTADPAVRSCVIRLVFQQFDQLAVRSTKEGYPKWPGFSVTSFKRFNGRIGAVGGTTHLRNAWGRAMNSGISDVIESWSRGCNRDSWDNAGQA